MLRVHPLLTVGLAALLALPACEQADPNSAAYWIEKLQSTDRREAIVKLGEMKAKEAVDALMAVFKDGRHRYEIVASLSQIGDQKAIPALLEALQDTNEPKAGQLAATTLMEWQAKDHADVYINVASNRIAPVELRYGALQLLAEFPDPKATQPLLTLLNGDPDLQPIVLNGLAAEALGKLGVKEAVPGLIACMWLDDHLHRNEVPRCRMALNRIGPEAAVPELINTLERKHRQVEARAKKFHFDKGGLIEAKAAEILGDMPDPRAVEPLIKELEDFEQMPVSVQADPKKAQAFVMAGVQKVISIANALAVIGDERAVEPLLRVADGKELALEYKLTAVQQLAFLGSAKAIPGLMKMLAKEPHRHDPVSQGFRVQIALSVANLLDGSDVKALEELEKQVQAIQKTLGEWIAENEAGIAKGGDDVKGLQQDLKAYQEWKGNYDEVTAKIGAIRECKADVACWGGKLAGTEMPVRLVAAYRLSQATGGDAAAARTELVKHAGDKDLTVRNVVLFGLDRVGDASLVAELEKIRAADKELASKDKRYSGAVYTVDLMIAKLRHRGA